MNRNPTTGRPSVAGYPGPALAPFLPFDVADEKNPTRALAEAAHFVKTWEKEWRIPPEVLRLYFSGMKGVSIEVPAELFGGLDPDPNIATHLKALAVSMAPETKTLDLSVYEKLRLWRVPNTLHGRSGLYKVRMTPKELLDED